MMDETGVRKVIVLTMATGPEFDKIYALYAKYPDRFEVWCGFDYTGYDKEGFGPAAVKELERCYKAGARGVGELGDKGKGLFYCKPPAWGMHLDDPRMDPLLEKCAELKMPVNIHVADPYWMYLPMDAKNDGLMNAYTWRLDNQPGIVGHQGMVEILERAVARHPKTTFIACHFANCCYDLSRLGQMFDKYPNLYADISARYAETAAIPRFVGRFYERYQDRLVYGTDMGAQRGYVPLHVPRPRIGGRALLRLECLQLSLAALRPGPERSRAGEGLSSQCAQDPPEAIPNRPQRRVSSDRFHSSFRSYGSLRLSLSFRRR